jgi:hypothetical protein
MKRPITDPAEIAALNATLLAGLERYLKVVRGDKNGRRMPALGKIALRCPPVLFAISRRKVSPTHEGRSGVTRLLRRKVPATVAIILRLMLAGVLTGGPARGG